MRSLVTRITRHLRKPARTLTVPKVGLYDSRRPLLLCDRPIFVAKRKKGRVKTSRRGFPAAAGAALAHDAARAADHKHEHGHDHQVVPSDPTLRVKALESLLVEKGLVDRAALDALVDTYEHKVGPRNGARVVARAWVDPAYKQRLLEDATSAIA